LILSKKNRGAEIFWTHADDRSMDLFTGTFIYDGGASGELALRIL
jgi:hypothetical protein